MRHGESLWNLENKFTGWADVPLTEKGNGEGKWALRRILERYLPIDLINRPKMGFGVPIDSWLRGPLLNWSTDLLDENLIRNDGYFKYEEIKKIWVEHQSGKYNHHHKLWNVLMFQAWLHNGKAS